MLFSVSHVMKVKLAVRLANTAPIPRVTKIMGKPQQRIVDIEANNPQNGNRYSFSLIIFFAVNSYYIIAIIHYSIRNDIIR